MKLVTPEQMNCIDAFCAESCGLPTRILMERAAAALREAVCAELAESSGNVVAFCGGGNNGGDGLAALLQLHGAGIPVSACLVSETGKMNASVCHYRGLLEAQEIPLLVYTAENASESLPLLEKAAAEADVILDCLFGTGFHGAVSPFISRVIEIINDSRAYVIAADIPSGVNGTDGNTSEYAVQADKTVTFGHAKPGNVLYPGREKSGTLKVADIGIPPEAVLRFAPSEGAAEYFAAEETDALLSRCFPKRKTDSHKGTFGKAGLIAGSFGMCGAAVLAAEACLRMGAGLVTLFLPHDLVPVCETLFREAVKCPVGEAQETYFKEEHLYALLDRVKTTEVLVIGPGLGSRQETYSFVRSLMEELSGCYAGQVILDADGLNAFAGKAELLRVILNRNGFGERVILTPHPAELSRLLELPVSEICGNRLSCACKAAQYLHATLLLKGASTVTACSDGSYTVNGTGNSGMATGGSGDVLSGIIGGLALRETVYESGRLGAFYHGHLGDIAASRMGEAAVLAGDLIEAMKN